MCEVEPYLEHLDLGSREESMPKQKSGALLEEEVTDIGKQTERVCNMDS